MMRLMPARQLPQVSVTVAADTTALDLYVACGSPAAACVANVTIATGVKVTQGAGTAPVRSGVGWPVGSVVRLVNNGRIYGRGGAGSAGEQYPTAGSPGGDAIVLDGDLAIDNTNGEIFAGGGGGAGGAGIHHYYYPGCGGGGGGGGRGNSGGSGGSGEAYGSMHGAAGAAGSEDAAGSGGDGGYAYWEGGWHYAQDGGSGGDFGQNGQSSPGASGGAAGYAVRKNGHAVTWIAGNNSAQVKGAVA